ncbi:MAG: murein transglycosylase A [Prochloraceae cyanobacterium]
MKKQLALILLSLGIAFGPTHSLLAREISLKKVERCPVLSCLGIDDRLWGNQNDRQALLNSIEQSLKYLSTPTAAKVYRDYPVPGFTLDRVRKSLVRFRQILVNSKSSAQFYTAIEREFAVYQSVGRDGKGEVLFTGYYEPIYKASLYPTSEYRYPLYRKPADFDNWSKPHPTRAQLEGYNGLLGRKSPLAGQELVWLRDRLEAYLVQVQGSARLELDSGQTISVGYNGSTDYPYVSIGREMIKDGAISRKDLSLPKMIIYLQANPKLLHEYISRNDRLIFFKETNGAPATGSINVPLTADRSIATDKSLMPPGALALIRVHLPEFSPQGELKTPLISRIVLDQDTGSAIKGAGRVDVFMGTGKKAGDRAGVTSNIGRLYYLLLKN